MRMTMVAMAVIVSALCVGAQQQKNDDANSRAKTNEDARAKTREHAPARGMVPLNVKLGLWEITHTSTMAGQLPISDEQMARLTPEQRARLEAAMKARSGQAHTISYRRCWTKEKLENGSGFMDKNNDCETTVVASDGSRTAIKGVCETQGMHATYEGEMTAVDPEHVAGRGHMTADASGRAMTNDITITGKWLASSCGNVD